MTPFVRGDVRGQHLGARTARLATRFATKGADKFRDVPYARSERGLPLIEGALASIECAVVASAAPGGTHSSSSERFSTRGLVQGSLSHTFGDNSDRLSGYSRRPVATNAVRDLVLRRRTARR